MKKLIFAMAVLLMAACSQKNEYKIDGKISGLKQGTAYLKTLENGSLVEIDTAEIKDGEFVFTGNVKEPLLYLIFIEGKPITTQIATQYIKLLTNLGIKVPSLQ